jgi:hypothetical protein
MLNAGALLLSRPATAATRSATVEEEDTNDAKHDVGAIAAALH